MLVGDIRAKGTNLKTNDIENKIIARYIISLKMLKKYSNNRDNDLTLSAFSEILFRFGKKGHKTHKFNE